MIGGASYDFHLLKIKVLLECRSTPSSLELDRAAMDIGKRGALSYTAQPRLGRQRKSNSITSEESSSRLSPTTPEMPGVLHHVTGTSCLPWKPHHRRCFETATRETTRRVV